MFVHLLGYTGIYDSGKNNPNTERRAIFDWCQTDNIVLPKCACIH